jgi:hypothetical protein
MNSCAAKNVLHAKWVPGLLALALLFGLARQLDSVWEEPATPPISAETRIQAPSPTTPAAKLVTVAAPRVPDDFDTTVQAVSDALRAPDAHGLSGWLAMEVSLGHRPDAAALELLKPESALTWLNVHRGGPHRVVEKQYVEHDVAIELVTDEWAKIAPIQNGIVELHLHRFNAQGSGEPLDGHWRIDTILFD